MLGPHLFNGVNPPLVQVSWGGRDVQPEADTMTLALRIQPHLGHSIYSVGDVSRYAPYSSIALALHHMMHDLETMTRPPTKNTMKVLLATNISRHVDPF